MRGSRIRALKLVAVAFALITSSGAFAETDKVAWVGGQFGLSVPNENNTTTRPGYGFDLGAKIGTEFGVGAYFNTSHKDENSNGTTTPFNYDLYGVMAGYFFEGEAKGVYLGGMLGMSKVGTGGPSGSYSTSPLHWGLVAGYDYLLGEHFSLGGRIDYFSVAAANTNYTTSTGLSQTGYSDAFSILDFMITAKVWF